MRTKGNFMLIIFLLLRMNVDATSTTFLERTDSRYSLQSSVLANTITLSSSSSWFDGYQFDPTLETYTCSNLKSHYLYYTDFNSKLSSFSSASISITVTYLVYLKDLLSALQPTSVSSVSFSTIKSQATFINHQVDSSSTYSDSFTFIQQYESDSDYRPSNADLVINSLASLIEAMNSYINNYSDYTSNIGVKLEYIKSCAFNFQVCSNAQICDYRTGSCSANAYFKLRYTSGYDQIICAFDGYWTIACNEDTNVERTKMKVIFQDTVNKIGCLYNPTYKQARYYISDSKEIIGDGGDANSCSVAEGKFYITTSNESGKWKWALKSKKLGKFMTKSSDGTRLNVKSQTNPVYFEPILI